jgi:hypothetical protein
MVTLLHQILADRGKIIITKVLSFAAIGIIIRYTVFIALLTTVIIGCLIV